ncbi:hypothetical protein GCM10023310_55990 [Paenibacillus vulneris]
MLLSRLRASWIVFGLAISRMYIKDTLVRLLVPISKGSLHKVGVRSLLRIKATFVEISSVKASRGPLSEISVADSSGFLCGICGIETV